AKKASSSAKEPKISTDSPAMLSQFSTDLISRRSHRGARRSLSRLQRGWSSHRRSFVLGSAFGLHLFGHEMIVGCDVAFDEGLRAIFECVRQRIAAHVTDRKVPALL